MRSAWTLLAALLLGLVITAAGLVLLPRAALAERPWEVLPLPPQPPGRIVAPESGALFVVSQNGTLRRSDDAGSTWRAVTLPSTNGPRRFVVVDPVDHRNLYADGDAGLYHSVDDAQSWQAIWLGGVSGPLTVSPASHSTVFALDAEGNRGWQVTRSLDGGQTWVERSPIDINGLGQFPEVAFFKAHPTNPDRLFFSAVDRTPPNPLGRLLQSVDGGASWTAWGPPDLRAIDLAGGFPSVPGRFYLSVNWAGDVDPRARGMTAQNTTLLTWGLFRTDDDGATWQSLDPPTPPGERRGPGRVAAPLIADPSAPDRLFARDPSGGVIASEDGGVSWRPLGEGGPGSPVDLALGVDGANLYALAEDGMLYRLALR